MNEYGVQIDTGIETIGIVIIDVIASNEQEAEQEALKECLYRYKEGYEYQKQKLIDYKIKYRFLYKRCI